MELAALDQFKKSLNLLLENYSKYFDDLLSGERSLPFGLLVFCGCSAQFVLDSVGIPKERLSHDMANTSLKCHASTLYSGVKLEL